MHGFCGMVLEEALCAKDVRYEENEIENCIFGS